MRPRRRAASALATLVALLAVLAFLAPAALAAPSAPSAPPASHPLAVRLAGLTPRIATPGAPVTVRATVTNAGATALSKVHVAARLGPATALRTREQARRFGAGVAPRTDPVVAEADLPTDLAPRTSATLELVVPPAALGSDRAFGVLPLTLVSSSGRIVAASPTFLPFQRIKEYEPLRMAFVAPLTADPDPAVVTASGADRAAAFAEGTRAGSRLARIVDATRDAPVTWAIDPELVDPGGPRRAETTAAGPDPETAPYAAAVAAFRDRVRGALAGRPVWALPPGDPDLSALTAAHAPPALLFTLLGATHRLAPLLGLPGVARVAWPAGSVPASRSASEIAAAFGAAGPTATLTPESAVDADPDGTATASRRDAGGRPLLAYDDELSRLFARTSDAARGPEVAQEFLAQATMLLLEAPGRPRDVLVAAPRTFSPDPGAAAALFDAVDATPWIAPATTTDLLARARSSSSPATSPVPATPSPFAPLASPLDEPRVAALAALGADVTGLAEVLVPTATSRPVPDTGTLGVLASARWRGADRDWSRAMTTTGERVDTLTTGVSVVPSTINFFAEHGYLQVTLVNNLDVAVHDVRLVLEPQGRPPRLRLTTQPAPLTIRPHSRTTVRVGVDAVAAGVVPVSAHLETPTNTRLGTDATVRVRVQPTNGWVMLGLGALVGVVFLAGLYRALRAGTPRASSQDLKEIDLE